MLTILRLGSPRNKEELQTFLDLTESILKTMPQLTRTITLLRHLESMSVHLMWSDSQTSSLIHLQNAITDKLELINRSHKPVPNHTAEVQQDGRKLGTIETLRYSG